MSVLKSFILAVALTVSVPVFAASNQLPAFADIVDKVGASVVYIEVSGPAKSDDESPAQGSRPAFKQALGSGFIISTDGFILTNAHVVEGADEVSVRLTDKREFNAKVIGIDTRSDVAVIKIDSTNLPLVNIGDPRTIRSGDWVVAIGSPFGFENSVTAGIVSARQRDTGALIPFIQTDVPINPGNSGGPLFNLDGEVVGINSQIFSKSGGYQGISLAIPIDEAMSVARQLRASGKIVRGRIGISISSINKEIADALGIPKSSGAVVSAIEPRGPAQLGGLEAGDIIVSVDGKDIDESSQLPRVIGMVKPNSRVTVQAYRDGKLRTFKVTVGKFPDEPASVQVAAVPLVNPLGLTVVPNTDRKPGVVVKSVSGPSERVGLQAGDTILLMGTVRILSVQQFNQLVRTDTSKTVSLLVSRGDVVQYIPIRPVR